MSFGSRRWFPYTSDDGTVYGKLADESNVEMIVPATGSQAVPAGAEALPPSIKPRMTFWKASNMSTKSIPIMTKATFDLLTEGNVYNAPAVGEENPSGTVFTLVRKVPERGFRKPVTIDTGKNDGDQP